MQLSPRAVGSNGAGAPLVSAVEMGYGHLRAAHALADAFGVEVTRADRPPHASLPGLALWNLSRRFYERVSRGSQGGPLAALWRPTLERLTHIEPLDGRDLTLPTLAAAAWSGFRRLPKRGLYRIVERVEAGADEAGVSRPRPSAPSFPGRASRSESLP